MGAAFVVVVGLFLVGYAAVQELSGLRMSSPENDLIPWLSHRRP